jgi:hypothetical protein
MKTTKAIVFTSAVVLSQWITVPSSHAQDLYKACIRAVCVTSNQSGGLVYRPVGTKEFIRRCAKDQGLTNLNDLSLVFNRTNNSLEVVSGTNHDLVCTPLSFSGGASLSSSNANATKVERLDFVYVDMDTMAAGTLAATERYVVGPSNQVTRFNLTGRLQYAVAAGTNGPGTNGTAIYTGNLIVGPQACVRHQLKKNRHHENEGDNDQGDDNDDQGEND